MNPIINQLFYTLKPLIPRSAQITIRRQIAKHKRRKNGYQWPIDPNSAKPPEGWLGWPDGKQFALVLSHDVDTLKGYNDVLKLADIEEAMGFRSSFNFVPERYGVVALDLLGELKQRGFGIGVHGLKHDGKLFSSKKIFDERALRINAYLKKWGARGFTTPSMIRNHDWMHALDIDHCGSTFDTDPFEPQPDGVGTIFPFWVRNGSPNRGYVEMPYTLPQDFTLFIMLKEKSIETWERKLDWVAQHGGMALLNTHPDYMRFRSSEIGEFSYPVEHYMNFLYYIKNCYRGQFHHCLPDELATFFRERCICLNSPHAERQASFTLLNSMHYSNPAKAFDPTESNDPTQVSDSEPSIFPASCPLRSKASRPLHILFIVENNAVPPDIRVWREAMTAKKAGYDVSVISPTSRIFEKGHEVIDGIEIYRHPAINGRGGKLNQVLEYANAFFWEIILCLKIFLKKRFDVIHGANPPDHIFLLATALRPFGVKYIFDHHDLSPELYLCKFNARRNAVFRMLSLLEKLSCLSADAVISTNESYKRHVIEKHRIKPDKVFVVRNDPDAIGKTKRVTVKGVWGDDLVKLLYVGSINTQDGVDLIVKVVHILVSELKQTSFHCAVVGDGDDLHCVKQLCKDLNMDRHFTFTGYIGDRELVKKYIEGADICLETAPDNDANRKSTFIKVMEYMSASKPIVAFDLDETRFSAAKSALLIEPGNLNAFAAGIMKLACDSALREKLGEDGRQRIEQVLNWDNASKELIRAYQQLERLRFRQ